MTQIYFMKINFIIRKGNTITSAFFFRKIGNLFKKYYCFMLYGRSAYLNPLFQKKGHQNLKYIYNTGCPKKFFDKPLRSPNVTVRLQCQSYIKAATR